MSRATHSCLSTLPQIRGVGGKMMLRITPISARSTPPKSTSRDSRFLLFIPSTRPSSPSCPLAHVFSFLLLVIITRAVIRSRQDPSQPHLFSTASYLVRVDIPAPFAPRLASVIIHSASFSFTTIDCRHRCYAVHFSCRHPSHVPSTALGRNQGLG